MANDINKSAGKLIERILADARLDADTTLQEAEQASSAILEEAAREDAVTAQAFIKRLDETTNAILERNRTNAELASRKEALDKRREVLESAFEDTYRQLCALDEEKRAKVCRDMLLAEAEGGETIQAAQAEKALLSALLPDVNAQLGKAGKAALTLADEAADNIAHGFLLKGTGFEKDCSFFALMRDARALEETNVSGILFD